jgi:hypothetical protein
MRVYIAFILGNGGAYIEAKLENGMKIPFRDLTAWNAKAKKRVKEHLSSVYGYNEVQFVT